jgi:hypothetical protein
MIRPLIEFLGIRFVNNIITTEHGAAEQDKAGRFRHGIRAISQSAEALLSGLRQQGARHAMLGLQLAGLLKDLRQQRSYSMDLAMGLPANEQFDAYISALGHLRGTVAQWLTIHAANPHAIEVEATDFEMQCFSTLGAGVMWLDSLHNDAEPSSQLSDEQMLFDVFGAQQAQGEDITDQVQRNWNEFTTQHGLVA